MKDLIQLPRICKALSADTAGYHTHPPKNLQWSAMCDEWYISEV